MHLAGHQHGGDAHAAVVDRDVVAQADARRCRGRPRPPPRGRRRDRRAAGGRKKSVGLEPVLEPCGAGPRRSAVAAIVGERQRLGRRALDLVAPVRRAPRPRRRPPACWPRCGAPSPAPSAVAFRMAVPPTATLRLPPVPLPIGTRRGVAVADHDLVEVHAEVVGDDLRERRLVPLAVGRGAGVGGDRAPTARRAPPRSRRGRSRTSRRSRPCRCRAACGRCAAAAPSARRAAASYAGQLRGPWSSARSYSPQS